MEGKQKGRAVKWRLESVGGLLAGVRGHLVALKGEGKTIKNGVNTNTGIFKKSNTKK